MVTLVIGHYRIRGPCLVLSSYLIISLLSPIPAIPSLSICPGLCLHLPIYLPWRSGPAPRLRFFQGHCLMMAVFSDYLDRRYGTLAIMSRWEALYIGRWKQPTKWHSSSLPGLMLGSSIIIGKFWTKMGSLQCSHMWSDYPAEPSSTQSSSSWTGFMWIGKCYGTKTLSYIYISASYIMSLKVRSHIRTLL